jgi:Endoplasmic Reticulum-Golgi Intermediate Compartment (ERGIC)
MVNFHWVGRLDMYRKVPVDLMEGTRRGSIISYFAIIAIVTLVTLETNAFLKHR